MITEQDAPPGTWVVCIDDSSSNGQLCFGHYYCVQRWNSAINEVVFGGVLHSWRPSRFDLAPSFTATPPAPTTGINTSPANGAGSLFDVDPSVFVDWGAPRPASKYPRCLECDRETCPELDAYYGTSAYLGKLCSECRRKSERDATY